MIKNQWKVVHQYVKFTNPLSFQISFPKVYQHTGGKWLNHGTEHYRDNQFSPVECTSGEFKHDINESEGNMLNQIFIMSLVKF